MDDDYDVGTGAADEELSLPKATVTKLIHEMMPPDVVCAKETRDLIADCCVEFIHLISSEANEQCEKENKKTIAGEHVIKALQELGFGSYVPEVQEAFDEHNKSTKERIKGSQKKESKHTDEELAEMQAALFAQARARMNSRDISAEGGSG
ncbi:histone-fold-containing protein [Fimicolochytrium jonesii]|uniref:histone-fold-containing protein n=1 Tax=Fimicolochytrium jonesii TaxID=1396493 RepID=UPI0022FF3457|nr:histone-fold-containing protein [Fimicolochytrium jonesii]KAI8818600.1 histone-fold-containing protein [Fimicolochytrium jonesii]